MNHYEKCYYNKNVSSKAYDSKLLEVFKYPLNDQMNNIYVYSSSVIKKKIILSSTSSNISSNDEIPQIFY